MMNIEKKVMKLKSVKCSRCKRIASESHDVRDDLTHTFYCTNPNCITVKFRVLSNVQIDGKHCNCD